MALLKKMSAKAAFSKNSSDVHWLSYLFIDDYVFP